MNNNTIHVNRSFISRRQSMRLLNSNSVHHWLLECDTTTNRVNGKSARSNVAKVHLIKQTKVVQIIIVTNSGVHEREAQCFDSERDSYVNEDLCEENNATMPETNKTCTTVDCEPR